VAAAGGALPANAAAWAALPGVGPYTAAAIASICFNESAPVVDGNVARVFARLLAWPDDFRKTSARAKLAAWLRPHIEASRRPGDFNQAMMDLGATLCTPRAPACARCPLHARCRARREGRQAEFPAKPPRRPAPVRAFAAALVRDASGRTLFVRRSSAGLLGGLWELPNLPLDGAPSPREALRALLRQTGLAATRATPLGAIRHAFTHFTQILHVYEVRLPPRALAAFAGGIRESRPSAADGLPQAALALPAELPLTTAARRALALRPA